MGLFDSVPERVDGVGPARASWWNLLRTAGIAVEAQVDLSSRIQTKITKGYADFSTAGLTNDIEVYSLAAKEVLLGLLMKHTTAFAGTSITAVNATAGLAAALEKYQGAFNILQSTGDTVFKSTQLQEVEDFGSSTSIRIGLTSVGANLDQLSAGSIDIWVITATLP